jgi:phage terminase small subunit
MPRARTPLAKAKATGQDSGTNKKRFEDRAEPVVKNPVGDPPAYMKRANQIAAWRMLSAEIPWLNESHRTILALACEIVGRMIAGEEIGVNAISTLKQLLSEMGATPSAASKVTMPDGDDKDSKDPSKKYF